VKFVHLINESAKEISICIDLLSQKKLLDMRTHLIKIKEYESNCDNLQRLSVKHLFATEKDTIKIIQYKEIYETLEEIADSCQGVANTLESIIMKNA
jgi:uncharacterized protein